MDCEPFVQPFPLPNSPRLVAAYRDLHVAANGSETQRLALGDPALLPRPWDPATITDAHLRAEVWQWLDAVVTWHNHQLAWQPDQLIPACWPHHPHLVHEIAVLADQRRRAHHALTSDNHEDFHRYTLPTFTDRLRRATQKQCDETHTPSPARGRLARLDRNGGEQHHSG